MTISPEKVLFSPTLSLDAPSRIEKKKIFDSMMKLFSISEHRPTHNTADPVHST
jgi:hypothetical protein